MTAQQCKDPRKTLSWDEIELFSGIRFRFELEIYIYERLLCRLYRDYRCMQ